MTDGVPSIASLPSRRSQRLAGGGRVLRASGKYGNFCHQPPSAVCNVYSLCCRGSGGPCRLLPCSMVRAAAPLSDVWLVAALAPSSALLWARTGPTADGGSVPPPPNLPQGASRDQRPTNDEERKEVDVQCFGRILIFVGPILKCFCRILKCFGRMLKCFGCMLK